MVICKYFQQGNCRFGQYCRFEHANNYGSKHFQAGSKPTYIDGKNIALLVAEDVLAAERGGQWMLSCYGPFKEQPCIPGMEDVSPEEVRWNMYKAQADGTTDQVKLQFQQMCQEMKAKHEALKNPTQETLAILEKLHKANQDKSDITFGSSSLGGNNSAFQTTNNVFGSNNTFGSNNAYNTNSTSIFNSGSSVFGGKPAFGNNSVFGGNSTSTSNFMFSNNSQYPSTFGTPPTNQAFGTNSLFGNQQSVFGQAATFSSSSSTQPSIFSQPVQSQSNIFGNSGNTNTIFANATTPSNNIFGAANQTPASNSIFAQAAATTHNFGQSTISNSMFETPSYSANSQVFNGPSIFNNAATSTSTTSFMPNTTVFGNAIPQNTVGPFATAATSAAPTFGNTFSQTSSPFSAPFASTVTTAPTTTTTIFGNAQTFGNVFTSPNVAPQTSIFSSPFAVNSTVTIVDESMYTDDSCLTDEEKSSYLSDQFILPKIPLNPPSKEIS